MIGRKFIFIAISIILLLVMTMNTTAAPILTSHHIVMIQGDDPATEAVEPGDRLIAIERFFFQIPYNETWVQVPVPKNASQEGMDLDHVVYNQQMQSYLPGDYSEFWNSEHPPYKEFLDMTEMDCCYADFYAWGFPENADRNLSYSAQIGTSFDFNASVDKKRTSDIWNYSDSDLKLKETEEFGDYYSVLSLLGVNITKVEMSWIISEHPDNISFFVSNNNGTSWIDVTHHNKEEIYFPKEGNEFLWKINMSQNLTINNTPVLDYMWINITFIDHYTEVTLQLDYILERRSGEFSLTWDFFKNKEDGRSPHILLYLDKDLKLKTDNINIQFWGDQTEFPDKDTYFFMSNEYAAVASVRITKTGGSDSGVFPWFLFLLFIIVALIVAVILLSIPKKEAIKKPSEEEVGVDPGYEEMEGKLDALKEKKAGLLGAIKKLDSDYEEGILDEDVYNELKGSYKQKTIEVMKEIDVLAAMIVQTSNEEEAYLEETPDVSMEKETLIQEKKKVLLSIKKLDSDFREGTIDEDTYEELRDRYKKKAVEIAKEIESME